MNRLPFEPQRLGMQLTQIGGFRPTLTQLAIVAPILISYIAFPDRKLAPLHALRLIALRVLLKYKGWLKAPTAFSTKLYMATVRFLSTWSPDTFAFQPALSRLPVPTMDHTIEEFLKSVSPLLTPEELAQTERELRDFQKGSGRKLHRIMQLMRWNPMSDSWLADIWLRVAYLMTRDPLPLASSYYGTDIMSYIHDTPTSNQAQRAATMTYMTLRCRDLVLKKKFPVFLAGGCIPMCMDSYELAYGTNRTPVTGEDRLDRYPNTRHIVVTHRGRAYVVEVIRSDGTFLTRHQLQQQMEWILAEGQKEKALPPSPPHDVRDVCFLSTLERNEWAEKRQRLMDSSELNKKSLDLIESAQFVISLDGPAPADMSGYVQALSHNNGLDRFNDKSFGIVVFENGLAGLYVEHTWADGTAMGHMWDWILKEDACCYEKSWSRLAVAAARAGKTPPRAHMRELAKEDAKHAKEVAPTPKLVEWDSMDGQLPHWIEEARMGMRAQVAQVQNRMRMVYGVGKDCMKKCKVSPDAFVQFALQVAHKRVRGFHSLTYESVSMRMYRRGRTETNRSLSPESVALVDALGMEKNIHRSPEEKQQLVKLFQVAAQAHQNRIRTAMCGDGVDRHLIGLRVVAKATGTDTGPVFQGPAFNLEWKLSTTTGPLVYDQDDYYMWKSVDKSSVNCGGGFTQCVAGGIGAAYFFFDDAVCIHANIRKGDDMQEPIEDIVVKFEDAFADALVELKSLFEKN